MDKSSLYKPFLLQEVLKRGDQLGRARVDEVVDSLREFYSDREVQGKLVEDRSMQTFQVSRLGDDENRTATLGMPFRKV
jgi:hypothetical protein